MVPLDYWLLRTVRRAMPQAIVDAMLDRGIYIKPGADTSEPERVARRYAERAAECGSPIDGKTVCVVGYGGGFGVGLQLLERGAAKVALQDPFAPTRTVRNRAIPLDLRRKYFSSDGNPDPDRIALIHEPLESVARAWSAQVDLVVSSSVLEHVSGVGELLEACGEIAAPGGLNLHYIDLRDHFFKYPFEMLCYSDRTWRRWLNASNNLNRLRLPDYERAFCRVFSEVSIETESRLIDEFRETKHRIRPEFLTGDEDVDAAAEIRVEARNR